MKKLLVFIIALVSVFSAFSQGVYPTPIYIRPNNSFGMSLNRLDPDSTLHVPTACGIPLDSTWLFSQGFTGAGQKMGKGSFYYDSCGHHLYIWDPALKTWHIADSSAGGGGTGSVDSVKRKPGTDSLFYYASGVPNFAGTDTVTLSTILASLGYVPIAPSDTVYLNSQVQPFTTTSRGTVNPPGAFSSRVAVGADNTFRTFVIPSDTSGKWVVKIYRSNDSVYFCKGNGVGGLTCTFAFLDSVGTGGGGNPFADNTALVKNNADNTKLLILSAASIATATTRTATFPNANITVADQLSSLGQFASTSSSQLATVLTDETGSGFAVFSASPALTGNPTAPNQSPHDSSTRLANTAYVDFEIGNQPIFTITPKRGLWNNGNNSFVLGNPNHFDSTVYHNLGNTASSVNAYWKIDSIFKGMLWNNIPGGATGGQLMMHMPDSSFAQVALGTNLSVTAGVLNAAGGGTSVANPSGLIGMSVVNGTATTATRSDGTHAIDPAIIPTWTGLHTFNGGLNVGSNILPTTTATYSLGSGTFRFASVFASNLLSAGDVVVGAASSARVRFQINGRDQSSILSTGQEMDSAYIGNVFMGGITGGTPDSVMTINNGFKRKVPASVFTSSGSTPTLPQVLASGRTLIASDSILLSANTSLHVKGGQTLLDTLNMNALPFTFDTCYFLGDSRTINVFGNTTNRYTDIVCNTLSLVQSNRGVSGMSVYLTTGNTLQSNLQLIPHKSALSKYLFWWFGSNDQPATGLQFSAGYTLCIDTALARGWSASDMYMLYSWNNNGASPAVQQKLLHDTAQAIATRIGMNFVDFYNIQKNINARMGSVGMTYDGLHDNVEGNNLIARQILASMPTYQLKDSAKMSVFNGVVDVRRLRLRNFDSSASAVNTFLGLGIDGKINFLPNQRVVQDWNLGFDNTGQAATINIAGAVKSFYSVVTGSPGSGQTIAVPGVYTGLISPSFGGMVFAGDGLGTATYNLNLNNGSKVIVGALATTASTFENLTVGNSGIYTNYYKAISKVTSWNTAEADLSFDSLSANRWAILQARGNALTLGYTTKINPLGGEIILGDSVQVPNGAGGTYGLSINRQTWINKDSLPNSSAGTVMALGLDTSSRRLVRFAASGASANIYNVDGFLTGNRTVTMGADNLTFSSTGGIVTLPNTTAVTTQSVGNNTTAPASTAFVLANTSHTIYSATAAGSSITSSAGSLFGTGVGSLTIPANSLSVGQTIIMHGYVTIATAVATPGAMSINPLIGGTGWSLSYSPVAGLSTNTIEVSCYFTVLTTGSSGTVSGIIVINSTTGTAVSSNLVVANSSPLTINTMSSINLDVQGAWGSFTSGDTMKGVPTFTAKIE